MLKRLKFNIRGIHCQSCKTLIETEIGALEGANKVNVDYINGTAQIEYEEEKVSQEKIFNEIRKLNYEPELGDAETRRGASLHEATGSGTSPFWVGLLIPSLLFIFIGGYFLVKYFGGFEILAKLNEGNVSYGLIFIIGILAGFHCVGMCGGLVVAYSAPRLKNAETRQRLVSTGRFAPHLQYNAGRLISYSAIGGILGGIGSFFGINPVFTGIITLLAGAFMVLMGLSFINHWAILEKIKIITPQFIARFLYSQKRSEKRKGPFLIGLLNGFMPCGPLQAIQLYALASGSVTQGGLSMAIYALGTIPLMFAFGSTISSLGQKSVGRIIKVSGILVIILGLFMANRGLANFGYGLRIGPTNNIVKQAGENNVKKYQEVKMDLTYLGYQPNVLYIKKGIPVRWVINVKEMTGCTNAIMIESLGIKKNLAYGENIIEFTPPAGVNEIKFSCRMRMVWGKFVITNSN